MVIETDTDTQDRPRIPWPYMARAGDLIIQELRPFCERHIVAGSIRRRKETCKDVEVLVIPKPGTPETDLFGNVTKRADDQLTAYLEERIAAGDRWALRLNKNGVPAGFGAKNKFLLWSPPAELMLQTGGQVAVDVFSTTAENFGMALFVRTGPAEWNVAAMARFQDLGMAGHAYGGVTRDGVELLCRSEKDVFELLEIPYVEPRDRTDESARDLLRRKAEK